MENNKLRAVILENDKQFQERIFMRYIHQVKGWRKVGIPQEDLLYLCGFEMLM